MAPYSVCQVTLRGGEKELGGHLGEENLGSTSELRNGLWYHTASVRSAFEEEKRLEGHVGEKNWVAPSGLKVVLMYHTASVRSAFEEKKGLKTVVW